jgi:hypothetical protein
MLLGLVAQYEKEAMGVVVGAGAIVAAIRPLRSGLYRDRPGWGVRRTRLVASAAIVVGLGIAVASFVVNVEDGTRWGTADDKVLFAVWMAAVAVVAVLAVRHGRVARKPSAGTG